MKTLVSSKQLLYRAVRLLVVAEGINSRLDKLRRNLFSLMLINGDSKLTMMYRGIPYTASITKGYKRIHITPTPEVLALLDEHGISYKTSEISDYLTMTKGDMP